MNSTSISTNPIGRRLGVLAAFVCVLLVLAAPHIAQAQAPTVNGLFYGDGDNSRYVPYATSVGGSVLYSYLDPPTNRLFVALVVSQAVNDMVCVDRAFRTYTESATPPWSVHRDCKRASDSEFASFTLQCAPGSPNSWTWQQALGCASVTGPPPSGWASTATCPTSAGTIWPPSITATTSWVANVNAYQTNPSPAWNMYVNGTSLVDWKSPFVASAPDNVTQVPGYPTYSAAHQWEWSMVYEWSVDLGPGGTNCGANPVYFITGVSHHSPPKSGDQNDPFLPPEDPEDAIFSDWGDLPDTYETLKASGGARNYLTVDGPYLGSQVQAELDGVPTTDATGDGPEEDGLAPVVIATWTAGGTEAFTIASSSAALLGAWIDWNRDGDFTDPNEYYTMNLVAGANTLPVTVGGGFVQSTSSLYARFRVFSDGTKAPGSSLDSNDWMGTALDGETEDYDLASLFDLGDAPLSYGTKVADGGPKHAVGSQLWLGENRPDGESDGQPNVAASGDNLAAIGGVDDEDGYAGLGFPLCPGNDTYSLNLTVNNRSGSTGYLVGYIDWNRDGDFADTGEASGTVSVAAGTTGGTATATWSSVPNACGGTTQTFIRFRFTTSLSRAESPTDNAGVFAPDGEVEDYELSAGTLPVTIARVESAIDGDQLTVRWTTASEWANAGFRLWGRGENGSWRLLDEVEANTPDSFTPQRYATTVAGTGIAEIMVEDVSLFNERRAHTRLKVGQSTGEEPAGMTVDWGTVRARARLNPAGSGMSARATGVGPTPRKGPAGSREGLLLVQQPGIQRVTHEELLAAGIDLVGIAPDLIAIVNDGVAVPRHVASTGSAFGPGSSIEFVAQPQLTLASPLDAYLLTVSQHRVKQAAALGGGAGDLAVTEATDAYRPDRMYSFSSPNGDPWFDQGLLAWGKAASTTRTFHLPNLTGGPVELDFKAWGYGGWPGTEPPDHHVVVLLNGSEIANGTFDDIVAWERTIDVTNLAQETGNVLEIRLPGDTGHTFDYVAFEGFSVRYPRLTVAVGQRFAGSVEADNLAIGGFDEGQSVSIWRHDGSAWFRGERTAMLGRVQAPGGGTLWAAARPALFKPGISAGVPEALASSKAEYLIVTHPAFTGTLDELVALEEGRGFATEVVTVDRIYAAYSDHAASADAIKRFLTASWEQGKLKYVLLVGADTTDPYNHLGAGSVSYVPTAYLPYVQYITFSPTDEVLVDADGDLVGEVPIGRLPVRTPAELQQVVAKLKAWESNLATGGRNALLTAGASDPGASLASINRSYASSLGAWNGDLVTAEEHGAGAVRNAVLAAMNAGTPLVSFVGHSSMGQWDRTPILKWQDVAGFANAGKPNIVAQWGCWNSYYVEPGTESLSARMLITPDAGVAAAIGATTLTTDTSHQMLGNLFYVRVNEGAATIGEAFHQAKRELRTQAVAHDAILGMALLGDPAMSLPK